MYRRSVLLALLSAVWARPALAENTATEQRIDDLLAQMTLEEKLSRVHTVLHQDFTSYVPPIDRLGIRALRLADGPAGIRGRGTSTALPAPIAVAACWDSAIAHEVGAALGDEAAAKGLDAVYAPALNIVRTPLGGRGFEYFGEDPYLTAVVATATVRGIQSRHIIACPKHYLCNNQEQARHSVNAVVDERTLREIYLPGFAAAVREGGALAVMAANNRVNGAHNAQNPVTLRRILKQELGFAGFVCSDYSATHDPVAAANAGLDLDIREDTNFGAPLRRAIDSGRVSVATLDDKVRRILRATMLIGEGKPSAISRAAIARRAAESGMVLLKNTGGLLPIDPARVASVAVLGRFAFDPVAGGGGSSQVLPERVVSPLRGLIDRLGTGVRIDYEQGADPGMPYRVPAAVLAPGLTARYYANRELSGTPAVQRIEPYLDHWFGRRAGAAGLPLDGWSASWTGTLTPAATGVHRLTFEVAGGSGVRLSIDDTVLLDRFRDGGDGSVEVELVGGTPYPLKVDFCNRSGSGKLVMTWVPPQAPSLDRAVQLARGADLAVVVAGDRNREGADRASLALPGAQDRLIEAVVAANPRTVVVLNTGCAVDMSRWLDRAAAVVQMWYPGGEGGHALAALLTGDVSPSGRLPVTFAHSLSHYATGTPQQYPGVGGEAVYSEGVFVGYRHFDRYRIEPAFCFGHGLSYTTFEYSGLAIEYGDPGVRVQATVTNTGNRPGSEVAQLYVSASDSVVPMPPRQLKGFQRVTLEPGQSAVVRFALAMNAFGYWDSTSHDWRTPDSSMSVHIGASSRDIRLSGDICAVT